MANRAGTYVHQPAIRNQRLNRMTNDVSFNRIPAAAAERWKVVRDVVSGDQAMRAGGYLPYLNAADKSEENRARNVAYVQRAVYYNATGRTLDGLLGLAFRRDPRHELPKQLEYLLKDADGRGNSVYQQSQASVGNVLAIGRHGLYVDYDERLQRPVIKAYVAESIINWRVDGQLTMVVLRETKEEADEFGLKEVVQFRELALENGVFVCRLWQNVDAGLVVVDSVTPRSQTKTLDFIPFQFIGSRNNDADIDDSPLYSLAQLNVAHFRNSADYEDSVFIVGQAQPYISGLTEEWRDHIEKSGTAYVGSRAPFLLPQGGAMGFAQPEPNTLVKEAMDQKEAQMVSMGARLLDTDRAAVTATQNENDKEATTSVLSSCVSNVNEAYQKAIGWCGWYMNVVVPEEGAYKISQEYGRNKIDATVVTALVAAWQSNVIAKPDLRAYLRAEGVIAVERTDEDIESDLEAQGPALGTAGAE